MCISLWQLQSRWAGEEEDNGVVCAVNACVSAVCVYGLLVKVLLSICVHLHGWLCVYCVCVFVCVYLLGIHVQLCCWLDLGTESHDSLTAIMLAEKEPPGS